MCGICGELRLDGQQPELNRVEKMTQRLLQRGPDSGGHFSDERIALGHRRLAIIDLSERASQPMVDQELGLVLVFNGTIYNYPELRKELQQAGYHFFSNGDSEVIIKAYHAWGEACVERLSGMFAFAIWDRQREHLFMARDRMGIKPFYFAQTTEGFRFASNIQALLVGGGIDTSIDGVALHHQFTLHGVVPAPHTILNGVRKLAPATCMSIDAKGLMRQRKYWSYKAIRPEDPLTEEEWLASIHDALRLAVRKRHDIADVPVGVLLSGGIDSSLLVALLAEAGVEELHTFSVGFEDHPDEKGNEFEYSDQVADYYSTKHHQFLVPNSEVLKRLPEAVEQMAEPMFGQDAVAFFLLGEQVSKEVKVVQSGQGADEVFAGYFWYPQMHKDQRGTAVEKFARYYFDRDHAEYLQMVTKDFQGEDHTSQKIAALLAEPDADTFLDAVLRMDVTTLIVDDPVKRVDNMTMAWGLEARVPFLDQDLVELVAQCPPELKLKQQGKYPLKSMAKGLLPESVINRPKAYFPVPALKYVRGEFFEFMQGILKSEACQKRGIFRQSYVELLFSAPEMHLTRLQGSKLWHLALLEFWLQTNVDGCA